MGAGREASAVEPSSPSPEKLGLGVKLVLFGICSYTVASYALRFFLLDASAAAAFTAQVPSEWRSFILFAFITSSLLDLLLVVFETGTVKENGAIVLPVFIKSLAAFTYLLIENGLGTIRIAPNGQFATLQRHVCWCHTSSYLLVFIKMLTNCDKWGDLAFAISCNVAMEVTGAASLLVDGHASVAYAVASHVVYVPVLLFLNKCMQQLSKGGGTRTVRRVRLSHSLPYVLPCISFLAWLRHRTVWRLVGGSWHI